LGSYYYRFGRYDEAIAMFQQVVTLAPESFRGYSSLGAAYFMKDRMSEAINAFEKSLAIKPNWAAATNLGTLYFFEEDYPDSTAAFRKAVSLEQGSYQAWGNLAAALQWTGQSEESAAAYRRARDLAEPMIRVNPKNVAVQMALANYNAALGQMDNAQAYLKEVLRLAPTDSHTLFQIADFYEFRLRQRDNALAWLAKAVERGQTWREIDQSPDLRDLRKDVRFQRLRHSKDKP
jgi:tetratricopeptide (TPR) repeat protein